LKIRILPILFASLMVFLPGLYAEDEPSFEDRTLALGIHELTLRDETGFPIKVVASAGDDGLLIVDSGYARNGPALVKALSQLGRGMPRIVINTHSHMEHIAGQAAFGRGPVIIGHKNLRDRYFNGLYVFNGLPPEALPQVTFSGAMSLFFNGEEIRLIAFPGAHDDSDIIVWFTRSKVVCTEAVCGCGHFPSVDGETGNILRYPEIVDKLIRALPDDVLLVPGHSEDCDMNGARAFLAMLTGTLDIVRAEMAKGKSPGRMIAEDVLAPYKSFESYMGRTDWLLLLAAALTAPKVERGERAWPYGMLYRAYIDSGTEGLLLAFDEMRSAKSEEYFLAENTLLFAGRRLSAVRHDFQGAIRVFERWLKEYPKGQSLALCFASLGDAYENLGNKAKALEYYKSAQKASPDDPSFQAKVKQLEAPAKMP